MKKVLVILGAAFVLLFVGSAAIAGVMEASNPTTTSAAPETTVEKTTTTEKVTTTTAAPTTTVYVPESDWDSEYSYTQELGTDVGKVVEISEIVADSMLLAAGGGASYSELVSILETARGTLDTYRDFYRGTVPPAGYEESHAMVLQAWDLLDEAWLKTIEGLNTGNTALIDDATALIERSGQLYAEATASIERMRGTA